MIFKFLRRAFNRATCDGIRIVESPAFKRTEFTLYEMSTGKTYSIVVRELDETVMVINMVDTHEEVR